MTTKGTKVVKLLNPLSKGNKRLIAELNDVQFGRLKQTQDDSYDPFDSGYINPSQVKGYFLEKNKIIKGCPELKVWIDLKEEWGRDITSPLRIGSYEFNIEGDSEQCVLYGGIRKEDVLEKRISPKYIVTDDSGIIISITRERVVDTFEKARNRCDEGKQVNFKYLKGLAKASGFYLDDELANLEKYSEQKEIERYSSADNLERVLSELGSGGFYVGEEQIGVEIYLEFIKMVEKVKFPNDSLKNRAIEILEGFSEAYHTYANAIEIELEEEIEKKRAEVKESKIEALRIDLMKRRLQSGGVLLDGAVVFKGSQNP